MCSVICFPFNIMFVTFTYVDTSSSSYANTYLSFSCYRYLECFQLFANTNNDVMYSLIHSCFCACVNVFWVRNQQAMA